VSSRSSRSSHPILLQDVYHASCALCWLDGEVEGSHIPIGNIKVPVALLCGCRWCCGDMEHIDVSEDVFKLVSRLLNIAVGS
jgi:hypothetical protein